MDGGGGGVLGVRPVVSRTASAKVTLTPITHHPRALSAANGERCGASLGDTASLAEAGGVSRVGTERLAGGQAGSRRMNQM